MPFAKGQSPATTEEQKPEGAAFPAVLSKSCIGQQAYTNEKETRSASGSPKSPLADMFGRAKAKIGEMKERRGSKGMDKLAEDEADFEKMKEKEQEEQRRKEDYERLDLANRTKFGTGGASFGA